MSQNLSIWLLIGLAAELGLLLFIVYTLPGNRIFGTQAFTPGIWLVLVILALAFGALEELRKLWVRQSP